MKRIISLQSIILMSLIVSSISNIQAEYSSKKASTQAPVKKGRLSMKTIENELHSIKREFERTHDAKAAHKKLEHIPAQIKDVVAQLKAEEKRGRSWEPRLWETHEHTLNRKLKNVREYISHRSKQNENAKKQQTTPAKKHSSKKNS